MFIQPSELSATELRSLVAIFKYGKPVPISCGFAFAKENTIHWKVLKSLEEYGLVKQDNGYVKLTNTGVGIGKSFNDRLVIGYD